VNRGTKQGVSSVLIVDDHPVVVRGVREAIDAEADLQVIATADSKQNALEHFTGAPPDVTVVDLSLGSGSGLELIAEALGRRPEARILVFSIHDEQVYAERALRAGARGYVCKDSPTAELIGGIRRVLRDEIVLSPEMSQRMLEQSVGDTTHHGSGVERLSNRELEIFEMIGRGIAPAEMAEKLGISSKTIETHCGRIKQKLHIETGRQLIRQATIWVERDG
jgi:DNA-binding NarL/FixJ family response regulator